MFAARIHSRGRRALGKEHAVSRHGFVASRAHAAALSPGDHLAFASPDRGYLSFEVLRGARAVLAAGAAFVPAALLFHTLAELAFQMGQWIVL